ncbi:hypothetical protein ACIBEJ_47595 [Nonomuraea sp. NPDC050790]|uniref:hypothetical protein n=1 Tax=Nonomuraea sp. NPDC050790 TaxID=3364371 RepID=UPI00379E4CDE
MRAVWKRAQSRVVETTAPAIPPQPGLLPETFTCPLCRAPAKCRGAGGTLGGMWAASGS